MRKYPNTSFEDTNLQHVLQHYLIAEEASKKRVLIVDDEPDIREFLSYNLLKKGFQVATAADGKTGYEIALINKPDLILLDILMPVMNGYETCRRFRMNPVFNDTRILFLSALNEVYAKELGEQLEADGFISKPIRIDLLIRRIEYWSKKAG